MDKRDVCEIDKLLETLEMPDDNIMLDTLLEKVGTYVNDSKLD